MWESIIGVCGTIVGTIIGWLLARSKKGKLKIEFSELYDEQAEDVNDGTSMPLKSYQSNIDLKLYNSGDKPTTARDFEISFMDNDEKEILKGKIYDNTKTKMTSCGIHYERINVINVPGLSGMDLKAIIIVNHDNVELIKNARSLYLVYKDDKFKEKRIKICEKDFCNYIQNLLRGEN